jgi:hypothetical protein
MSHTTPHPERVAAMNEIWCSWRETVEAAMRQSLGRKRQMIGESMRRHYRVYNPDLQAT